MQRDTLTRTGSMTIALWLAALAGFVASPALAQQPVNGFRELAAAVRDGDSVTVRDQGGKTVRGTVAGVSPSVLRVRVNDVVREWTPPDVSEVRRRGDSLLNGTLWGLAIGGGGAAILGGLTYTLCANEGGRNCPQMKVLSVLTPLAAGVGAGLAIDAARTAETVLYTRPGVTVAPVAAPRLYGVTAAWRF